MFNFIKKKSLQINKNVNLNLHKICDIMGVALPFRFRKIADRSNNDLVMDIKSIKSGSICFYMFEEGNLRKNLKSAVNKGVEVVFVGKDTLEKSDVKEREFPIIVLENRMEQVGKLFSTIRKSYKAKTVAITGSVGKTTTNQLLKAAISKEKNTYASGGNLNSYISTARHIVKKLNNKYDVYIQEVGAAAPKAVEKSARMLMPDIAILLNVKEHHINRYGSQENLFYDKASFDRVMDDKSIIIANFDDDMLAKHKFSHKVISFGIEREDVDYRAINIKEENEFLSFDVVHNGAKEHIKIRIIGRHNVYNALAAYAGAMTLGVGSSEIIKQFENYRTEGIRQNIVDVGGYKLYMDCYNAAFDSIKANFESLEKFELESGKRKIAVIGGENGVGKDIRQKHFEFGKELSKFKVDEIICIGPDTTDLDTINYYGDGKSIYEGLKVSGYKNVKYFSNNEEARKYIEKTITIGDMILFKGIIWLDFPILVDKIFGTSFSFDVGEYKSRLGKVQDPKFVANVIPQFACANIIYRTSEDESVNIPNKIAGLPVYRVTKKIFEKNKKITKASFGMCLRNISEKAFYMCEALKEVNIPSNVKVIEKSAFEGCAELEIVNLEEGLTHISEGTFKKCGKLQSIDIPMSVNFIGEDAFKGCDNLVIKCEVGSYAEKYAQDRGIAIEIK